MTPVLNKKKKRNEMLSFHQLLTIYDYVNLQINYLAIL